MIHLLQDDTLLLPIRGDIPVPPMKRPGGGPSPGPFFRTARALRVGQSFIAPDHMSRGSLSSQLRTIPNRRFTTQKTPEGVRVWRVL